MERSQIPARLWGGSPICHAKKIPSLSGWPYSGNLQALSTPAICACGAYSWPSPSRALMVSTFRDGTSRLADGARTESATRQTHPRRLRDGIDPAFSRRPSLKMTLIDAWHEEPDEEPGHEEPGLLMPGTNRARRTGTPIPRNTRSPSTPFYGLTVIEASAPPTRPSAATSKTRRD